jgi:uncharacterized protein (DUF3084 family)
MKILPRKIDIDRAKSNERKQQIDEGVALALKVDQLRQLKPQLEKNLEEWRLNTTKVIQEEIDVFINQRDIAEQEAIEARKKRDALREPLDDEWAIVLEEKEKIKESRNDIFLDRERISAEEGKIETKKQELKARDTELKKAEQELENQKLEVEKLKEKVIEEMSLAKEERETNNQILEKKIAEANSRIEEYKVAFQTIELREKQVDEKEKDLIIRERTLYRRTENVKRAEANKQNG